ncbi:telomere capping, CST complex subunit-domain-containing protein [Neurospora hispaniola]|uniref:Telomere capping, CST complex subunit-domain-containing protein n=1 Tax=Neurospora hispaniola TaxID=588809 RepID=A0AAJ0IFY2_9PEZI|nr:telomere capping, CST complex subunit-domain-containing protein [Neurospora hispaniola]
MSNGPLPSQLCLLPDLALKKEGDKVRFWGCVTSYSTVAGVLTLQHHHQAQDSRCVVALVDVTLALRTLKSDQLQTQPARTDNDGVRGACFSTLDLSGNKAYVHALRLSEKECKPPLPVKAVGIVALLFTFRVTSVPDIGSSQADQF